MKLALEGGCYCGALRYASADQPLFRVQCHCRECQHFSGGHPAVLLGLSRTAFRYTKGEPERFCRDELADPVTREFCARCGTHVVGESPRFPAATLVKVGTLDEPALFGRAQLAIFTVDAQSFHTTPEGVPAFERLPTGV